MATDPLALLGDPLAALGSLDVTSLANLESFQGATGMDLSLSFGKSTVKIVPINCDEMAKDKTFDYYYKMIEYKIGFNQSLNNFIEWGWFQYIMPW